MQRVTAAGAITAGDAVISAAGGQVATYGATTDATLALGVALTTVAAGAAVEVQFTR